MCAVKINGILINDKDIKKTNIIKINPNKKKNLVGLNIYYFEGIIMFDGKIIKEINENEVEIKAFNRNKFSDQTPFKRKILLKDLKFEK